jgi:antitoxin ParD1/3/4
MSTTTMNISLPDGLKEFVDSEVSAGGYTSASEYMRELLRDRKAKKDLDERLLAALKSEDLGELTPEFFEGLREQVRKRARDKRTKQGGK